MVGQGLCNGANRRIRSQYLACAYCPGGCDQCFRIERVCDLDAAVETGSKPRRGVGDGGAYELAGAFAP